MNVREAVYDLLRHFGATTVFGNPGSNELPFLGGFPEDFRYVLGLHEGVVVSMADGYAQAFGRTAFVNLHSAAGVGNAMGAMVNARASRTPLVVTAGQQAREMIPHEALLANVDATRLPEPMVKWSTEPARPEDVPTAIARAFHIANLPPKGPVFVSLPLDDWSVEVDEKCLQLLKDRDVMATMEPSPGVLKRLAEKLGSASNPLIVLGAEVDETEDAYRDAALLAERLDLPVWVAPSVSRCPFPTDHPNFRGVLPTGIKSLAGLLAGHDEVLVVGAPVFRYHQYEPGEYLPEGTRLTMLTSDSHEAACAPMGDAVVVDVGEALNGLVGMLPDSGPRPPAKRSRPVRAEVTSPLSAESVYDVLDSIAPRGAAFVNESTSDKGVFWDRVTMSGRGSYYFAAAGGLGFGMAAAVGVKLAEPERPVIAVIGDGSAQYAITALWSAARYGLPVTFIIMRNGSYDVLEDFGELLGVSGVPGIELPGIDHLFLAAGYGVSATRAETVEELETALKSALHAAAPHLIEVPVRRRKDVKGKP